MSSNDTAKFGLANPSHIVALIGFVASSIVGQEQSGANVDEVAIQPLLSAVIVIEVMFDGISIIVFPLIVPADVVKTAVGILFENSTE